ncbi:MAG TPA: protein-L-isoaspartate(D-aspartate) O-methyltransferase [Kofleriaceae bacterium]|nr:protein-L-isoaspartate(D-aspartate) O-methyltransferase [Kofleriaceae bacterium]
MWTGAISVVVVASCVLGCGSKSEPDAQARTERRAVAKLDPYRSDRERMVDTIASRGVRDPRVLEAMRSVPRHELVPADVRADAYDDRPLPIGFDKTISQPYIIAVMTEAAKLHAGDRVLEIGTGSGYQAALLAELGAEVYTIEILEPLANRARDDLQRLGYREVEVRAGDGYRGWREHAPFDAILVTAAAPTIPEPLYDQLAIGGRMVIPVGDDDQYLKVITKLRDDRTEDVLFPVRFGPMLGEITHASR